MIKKILLAGAAAFLASQADAARYIQYDVTTVGQTSFFTWSDQTYTKKTVVDIYRITIDTQSSENFSFNLPNISRWTLSPDKLELNFSNFDDNSGGSIVMNVTTGLFSNGWANNFSSSDIISSKYTFDPAVLHHDGYTETNGFVQSVRSRSADRAFTDPIGISILQQYRVLAVPEPAAWIMMLTGFALVGSTLRRRSTQPLAA